MSLLQNVLRSQAADSLDKKLSDIALNRYNSPENDVDSDDELINVTSLPGTPPRSGTPSRPTSPSSRPGTRSPIEPQEPRLIPSDPLKAFPSSLSQRIFTCLSIAALAKCARVSKKWNRSQTINYVWFQHYRRENLHDQSLPLGKWTKRESKQNWRVLYLQADGNRSPHLGPADGGSRSSGRSSPSISGQQTPKELREEKWRLEAEAATPSKTEMRRHYKTLDGRKPKTKTKLGSTGGTRDKGGWEEGDDTIHW